MPPEGGSHGFGRAFCRWQLEANPKLFKELSPEQQRTFREFKPKANNRVRIRDMPRGDAPPAR